MVLSFGKLLDHESRLKSLRAHPTRRLTARSHASSWMLNPIDWRAFVTRLQPAVSRGITAHADRGDFVAAVDRDHGRAKAENIAGDQGLHAGDDGLGPV